MHACPCGSVQVLGPTPNARLRARDEADPDDEECMDLAASALSLSFGPPALDDRDDDDEADSEGKRTY